jgi:hypothetical protein
VLACVLDSCLRDTLSLVNVYIYIYIYTPYNTPVLSPFYNPRNIVHHRLDKLFQYWKLTRTHTYTHTYGRGTVLDLDLDLDLEPEPEPELNLSWKEAFLEIDHPLYHLGRVSSPIPPSQRL